MPDAITRLFKEAHDAFPPLEGKPSNDDLLAIRETLLPLLMVIPYDNLNGVHSLTAILTKTVKYKADNGAKLVHRDCLPLCDKSIADDAMTVVHVCADASHKSQLNDYASHEAAEQGMAKLLCNIVDEVWFNDLTFPTPSTQRSWPLTSWPSLMPTAEGFMLLTQSCCVHK
jgi:hypothetical protein